MRLSPISPSWRTVLRLAPVLAVAALAACETYPPTYTLPTPNPSQIQITFKNGANPRVTLTVGAGTSTATIHLPVSRDTSLNSQEVGVQVGGDTASAIVLTPSGTPDEGSVPARGYAIKYCVTGTYSATAASNTCALGTPNGIGAAGAAGTPLSFTANPVDNFGGWFAIPAATAGTTFTVVLTDPSGAIVPNLGPFTITVISP